MNCPGWLLKIVCSYLRGRSLIVRWQSKQSRKLPLNSGAGQGTIMGLFLFCITFNGAGPKAHKEPLGQIITQPRRTRKPIKKGKKKWVDDLTVTVPIRLQDKLIQDPGPPVIGPSSYHNRTGQILPEENNSMQFELASLNQYCIESKMSINKKKSVCMLFNRAVKHDFMPKLYLNQDSPLEVVEEMKLVGYQLRSDLRTISNTNYIVKRAWKRMWIVRRLKVLGASEQDLLKVLRAQVLSVLQFATPAWSSQLTVAESNRIESVLKTGLYLVYGDKYESFNWALSKAKMCSLQDQRTKMFKTFTQDCIKSNKFRDWFMKYEDHEEQGITTRQNKPRFKPVYTRTSAFARSAIPQMVRLANSLKPTNSPTVITLNSGQTLTI